MNAVFLRALGPVMRVAPRSLKQKARTALHRVANGWTERLYSFTAEDLVNALGRLGVREGDLLCVHSSYNKFIGFKGDAADALRALQRAVGPNGGLMMPNQPSDDSVLDYLNAGKITSPRTPSAMGMLTELLRRTRDAVRTVHPTHPVALWGKRGVALAGQDWTAGTPCGRGTAYYRLLEEDGAVLMLGTGFRPVTFYHCVEELIEPELPFSPFTDEFYELKCKDAAGDIHTSRMRLYARELAPRSISLMAPRLKNAGRWRETRVGKVDMILVRAQDILATAREMARAGHYCYRPESIRARGPRRARATAATA